jgi:hypothetical protein
MDAIQAEMDKFSMSEVEYKEKIKIAHDTIFRLKAMLTVLLVILLGFTFKSVYLRRKDDFTEDATLCTELFTASHLHAQGLLFAK